LGYWRHTRQPRRVSISAQARRCRRLLASELAAGADAERLRSCGKNLARETCDYVNWLTSCSVRTRSPRSCNDRVTSWVLDHTRTVVG
jgi:hypothetical protein